MGEKSEFYFYVDVDPLEDDYIPIDDPTTEIDGPLPDGEENLEEV